MAVGDLENGEPFNDRDLRTHLVARWIHDSSPPWDRMQVCVGTLPDGRWYVETVGQVITKPRAYSTKQAAWVVARNWMGTRDGPWRRIDHADSRPAYPPPTGPTPPPQAPEA